MENTPLNANPMPESPPTKHSKPLLSKQEAIAYLEATRSHFATYHNHKEYMVYVVMTFYLAGISILVAGDIPWNKMLVPCDAMAIIGNVLICLLFLAFIWWHLRNRTIAANIIEACDIVRFQIWTNTPPPLTTATHHYKNTVQMFCFLWRTAEAIKKRFWRWVITHGVPIALIIIWHALLFLRIHSTCQQESFNFFPGIFLPFSPFFQVR